MLRDGNAGMSTIPGFSQIQFEGFCRFIDRGLTEEFYKFPKIEDTDQEIEFQLFVETYQLVEPLIKERDDVYASLTYSSGLYVPAGLIWKTGKDRQEQTIFIGKIPLMNSLGTSIVNGIYRIVINQILQSPSIYYRSELDHNGISVYTGTIISVWGGRLELEIDKKNKDMGAKCGSGNYRGAIRHKFIPTPQNLVTSTPLTTTYESFFGLHPLSQVLDRTNPLTQIVHGRKLSYLGPGGLTGRTASFRIRDIQLSHYGRICPINTSEGINVGLIGSLEIHARIGYWGSLERPFYEICEKSKEVRVIYLSPSRDESYMVAAGISLALNPGIQEEQVVPARYRQEFLTIAWEQIHLRSIFPFQYFSIGASLIPFIEHNDANRALMSSNMQRQAVPLSRSEKCIVGTGLERQAALDSGISAIAEHEGKIIYTDTDKIMLSGNGDTLSIPLVMYQRSNKNTCMHKKSQVPRGKCIKKGQILANGAATVGGELALGKNVLVAYMQWEGYNFEDAVHISERLVYGDIYTSFHIRKYEIKTYVTSQGPERITNEIPHLEAHLLRNLDRNGIVMLGSWVETGDILVEDRLVRAILGIQVSTAKETCLKLPIGGRGRVIDKREIKVGDKVAGRHENKGIISKILPRQDMPYLQDGTPVDMVFNPLGVPSRMNVGQIFECSLGYELEASRKLVFSELYEASKKTTNPWVFEPEHPGKSIIFDGRTRDPFEQPVIIGKSYILKLIHQVDDKIHGSSSAHYALRGRAKRGGEMLTYKSDHIRARQELLGTTIIEGTLSNPEDTPKSFRLLVQELRSLALELNHFLVSEKNFQINRKEA
ncbi:hypothetical protein AQUCO_06400064v1 [Aquilegia coerulea]|uniref:DNA-directed RNA polymerase n=1 Tax=Aquilegia coerulea TaxID=218851 RepID=A0A2G5CCQ3_AQUCA|nr:hypothetical protein AQUCO_06400064v1 [Aquilegia coerulea]